MMDKPVLLYDGQCALCQDSAELVRRLDWRDRVERLDAHAAPVEARFPDLDPAALMTAIHLITPAGEVLVGFEAVRALVRYLPPVAWLGPILRLPGMDWLGPRLYALVARSRYRINRLLGRPVCASGVCGLPR